MHRITRNLWWLIEGSHWRLGWRLESLQKPQWGIRFVRCRAPEKRSVSNGFQRRSQEQQCAPELSGVHQRRRTGERCNCGLRIKWLVDLVSPKISYEGIRISGATVESCNSHQRLYLELGSYIPQWLAHLSVLECVEYRGVLRHHSKCISHLKCLRKIRWLA
jgi:hypothetical protein